MLNKFWIVLHGHNLYPLNSSLTACVIRTLRIREVIPFYLVSLSKFWYKSYSFLSLLKVSNCTRSVSNKAFLLHKSQLPINLLILQTLWWNTFHLLLWCIRSSVWNGYNISGLRIYCKILSFYIYIWHIASFRRLVVCRNRFRWYSEHMKLRKDAFKTIFICEWGQ